jgi:predicted MPP superfamily phosphohydrolase
LARVTPYTIAGLRDVAVPRLRIAILSDFHANRPFMGAARLARLAEQAQDLSADLVLLLGDYAGHVIGGRSLSPTEVATALAPIRAPQGVFAVFGNHDWRNDPAPKTGTDLPTIWHRAFAEAGVPVLSNAVLTLEAQGVPFQLAGLESQRAFKLRNPRRVRGADDLPAVMRKLDPSVFTLLMAHEPDVFPDLDETVDLTVSGHTHGGQIVPFGRPLIVPSRHGTRYAYGAFTEGRKHLVVSGGLGNTTLPFRIGRPPEIVLIDLMPTGDAA